MLLDSSWPRRNAQVLMVNMNLQAYEGLPADVKTVIDANSGRNIAQWMGETWVAMETAGERAAVASGEAIYLSAEEVEVLRQRSQRQVAERWIAVVEDAGIDGRALVEEATALLEHYGRLFAAGALQ
ncbi:MAG: hypothetical protein OXF98_01935 [Rhodospirillaceae bacterium]|nr:hypothetical protein [Rhodospirillaceae bacterium]